MDLSILVKKMKMHKFIKRTFQMKTYFNLLMVLVVVLSACSTPQGAASNKAYDDDIYYSSADAARENSAAKAQQQAEKNAIAKRNAEIAQSQQNNAATETRADDDYYPSSRTTVPNASKTETSSSTTTSKTAQNTSFNYDDYYDYEYAVRLKRFHSNIPSYGYYDNYYTNSYWYSGNPYNYGTSVYMGYNFWGPSYFSYAFQPQISWYSNWGWGYNPYSYNPYSYNPYGYYGYNPYMSGYWNGYNDGHWNSHYHSNNYFNSYDKNSYYGPRNASSSNASGRGASEPSMAHKYMNAVETETRKPFEATKGRDNNPYSNPVKNATIIKNTDIPDRPATNQPHKNQIGNTPIQLDTKQPIDIKDPVNHTQPVRTPIYNNIENIPVKVAPNIDVRDPVKQEPSRTPSRNNIENKPIQVAPHIDVDGPMVPEQPVRSQPDRNIQLETPRSQPRYEEPRSQPTYEEPRSQPRYEEPRSQPRYNNNSSPSAPRGGSSGSPRPR